MKKTLTRTFITFLITVCYVSAVMALPGEKGDAKVMCKSFKNDITDVLKLESLYNKFSVKRVYNFLLNFSELKRTRARYHNRQNYRQLSGKNQRFSGLESLS